MSAWRRLTGGIERVLRLKRKLARAKKVVIRSRKQRVAIFPDLSYAQGSVNFKAIAKRADVVILKVTEGIDYVDPTFTPARLRVVKEAAEDAGLIVGYYHFARADNRPSEAGARAEARHFVATVRLAGGALRKRHVLSTRRWELPGVLDYETRAAGSVDHAWKQAFAAEYEKLTKHGVAKLDGKKGRAFKSGPILYAGNIAREEGLRYGGEPLWVPVYGGEPWPYLLEGADRADLVFHQFSEEGRFDGVDGDVDLNRPYLTMGELLELAV